MIKSTKTSLKFANKAKRESVINFLNEYKNITQQFIDTLWDEKKIRTLLPKEFTTKIATSLSQRVIQCAGKQASGIVRGTRRKQEKRLWVINKLNQEGKHKQARKLQRIYDKAKVTKPNLESLEAELDSRFVKVNFDENAFSWITLSSIGDHKKLILPFKKTKHFNKLNSIGVLKPGIRLSKDTATFNFEIAEPEKKTTGKILGIDIGIKKLWTSSNGKISHPDNHGWTLDKISQKLVRKTKGSNGFQKAQEHRKNFINWSINQINLTNVRQVNIESMKNLRLGKKSSRFLSHFVYPHIFAKLEDYYIMHGVHVNKVSSAYTSKRCSKCGWVHRLNRKGEKFVCRNCNSAIDADLNAALNIQSELPSLTRKQCLLLKQKKAIFWLAKGQEPIVLDTQEPKK